MGCVSYVAIKGGGVEVGEGQGRVQFVEEKSGKSVGSSDGESQVQLGEVNVSRELKGGHSCVCQESCVDAIYMEDSCQGQIEFHFKFEPFSYDGQLYHTDRNQFCDEYKQSSKILPFLHKTAF